MRRLKLLIIFYLFRWQFCGSPHTNHDLAVSWDGYALSLPLPPALLDELNPWSMPSHRRLHNHKLSSWLSYVSSL